MAQSLSRVLLHVVFSTKGRRLYIPPDLGPELYAYLASVCRTMGCDAYRVGGEEEHVHIASSLARTIAVSDLVGELKRSSSAWLKARDDRCRDFRWRAGYGVFSVGQSELDNLIRYIENQKEHHATRSFEEEIIDLFDRNDIEYDERYLWD